jgi:hypothetical protein
MKWQAPSYVFAFEEATELAVAGLRDNGMGTDSGVLEPCIRGDGSDIFKRPKQKTQLYHRSDSHRFFWLQTWASVEKTAGPNAVWMWRVQKNIS